MQPHEHHCHSKNKTAYKLSNRLLYALFILIFIWGVSFLPSLAALNESYVSYLSLMWWPVLLGFLIAGIIDYFVPKNFIYRYLGQKKISSICYAALAGVLLSACSHGILAIAIELYKKGANIPSVVTFLLASPWANLPTTILLFNFFGSKAFLFIFAAILIAVSTGLILSFLEKNKLIEQSLQHDINEHYHWDKVTNFNLKASINGVSAGVLKLANMVLWWIVVGFIIAVLIKTFAPHTLFHDYFNADLTGLALTLGVATIIEVCSEGSSPIAFEVYNQIGALGNPFVFLMAGVATDYTEIGLIWANIGKRTAIWLPLIAVPQILLIGFLFNQFL